MVVKKGLLYLFLIPIILVLFSGFMSAAIAVTAPANNTNNSGIATFTATFTNVTDGITNPANATFYYNLSGIWTAIGNTSVASGCVSGTCTVNLSTAGLTDGVYSINVTLDNGTDTASATLLTKGVRFDNTAPAVVVANFTPADGTATSNAYIALLNLTLSDAEVGTIGSVVFNVTNSSGSVALLNASNPAGNSWNATLNMTGFAELNYTINIIANDSLNNTNSSASVSLLYDHTAPSAVTLTANDAGTTSTIIKGDIAVTDALSGANSSCTVDSTLASISGTTNAQTLTQSGLSCGKTVTYIVTCSDKTGNSTSASSTSLSTDACPSGSGSSGSVTTIGSTYSPSESQLKGGYSKLLKKDDRIKFRIVSTDHYITLLSSAGSSVTIEIASDPVKITLGEGQDAKVDVDNDGVYDIYLKLSSILGTQANLMIQKISEPIAKEDKTIKSENGTTVKTEGTVGSQEEQTETSEVSSSKVLWILLVIVVLAIAVGFGMRRKRKQRYMMYGF